MCVDPRPRALLLLGPRGIAVGSRADGDGVALQETAGKSLCCTQQAKEKETNSVWNKKLQEGSLVQGSGWRFRESASSCLRE